LHNEGVLVLFPSGTIATKQNLKKNTKADDGEWKQWVSKLVLKTKSPVLPIFFDGQNSQLYHIANKIGQTFRYSLCMYELKRKIGDDIHMYFGSLIPYENLVKIGDIKKITQYLRSTTYSLDPQFNN
jgi:putative hemolysin